MIVRILGLVNNDNMIILAGGSGGEQRRGWVSKNILNIN